MIFEASMKPFSNSPKFLSAKLVYNILKALFAQTKIVPFNSCSLRRTKQKNNKKLKLLVRCMLLQQFPARLILHLEEKIIKTWNDLKGDETFSPVGKLLKLRKQTTQRPQEVPEIDQFHQFPVSAHIQKH